MRSSLGKLKKFALHKSDAKEKIENQSLAHLDELAHASQDMQDMRNCYDSLLSAAAATANSAYEFSESLREMGTCLLEKKESNEDGESGRLLSMLGKVQFELQKLVDSYRSHIFLTITTPSESLLNELRTVEEMKRQCDEKRKVYEYMKEQHREKGRSKSGKGESFTSQQLQTAHDEYEEEATLCVFRLKSLKQGQSRSLLTQAARHHAAQLNFFRKGLKSLDTVEPHVRLFTEQQHIDYQFSGLEDDDVEEGWDDDGENGDGELSFDYRQNKQGPGVVSTMEVDQVNPPIPQTSIENTEVVDKEPVLHREHRVGSHSAPIIVEYKKFDPAEMAKHMGVSHTKKLNTYVLPTPVDVKTSSPSRTSTSAPRTRPPNTSEHQKNLWHSSPLEVKKQEENDDLSALKENNNNNTAIRLPLPLPEGLVRKRQAFSGPLTSKPWSTKVVSASGPITSTDHVQHPSSSSPTASPPLASSPRISELHELPRPPPGPKPVRSQPLIGHSAPLMFSATNKIPKVASPLPTPPIAVSRSFSIPSTSQRAMARHVAKHLDSSQIPDRIDELSSPPLTPLSLAKMSTVSQVASHSGQLRGN